jgi:hypothetical protein
MSRLGYHKERNRLKAGVREEWKVTVDGPGLLLGVIKNSRD